MDMCFGVFGERAKARRENFALQRKKVERR
jgi:hypothetical protein